MRKDADRIGVWSGIKGDILVAAFLLLICLPFLKNVPGLGDEGVLLHGAQRILQGEMVYRDFFEFLPPLGFAFMALWMEWVGDSLLSARLLALIMIALIALAAFQASRLASGRHGLSVMLVLSWLIASQGNWTVINHHWFTGAFVMSAFAALLMVLEKRMDATRGALVCGILIGAAGMTTSAKGAAAAIVALLVLLTSDGVPRRALLAFIAGITVLPALLAIWLGWNDALLDGVRQFVFFAGRNYSSIQWVPFGRGMDIQNFPLVPLFPLAALLALAAMLLERGRPLDNPTFRAALLFGGMGWLTCFPRPDAVHIGFTAPLALPLMALSLGIIQKSIPSPRRWVVPTAIAIGMIPSAVKMISLGHHVQAQPMVETERGEMILGLDSAQDLRDLLHTVQRTPRGDGFFFYPYDPMLPYLTGRRHVGKVDIFLPGGYTTDDQYLESSSQMLDHAQWVVIDKVFMDINILKTIWPSLMDTSPRARQFLEAEIDRAYSVVMTNPHYALYRRRESETASATHE